MRDQCVYFIRSGAKIKIGISADLQSRFIAIRSECEGKAELLGAVEGDKYLERSLHKKLRPHRLEGEWFKDCREVHAAMQNCLNNFPVYDALAALVAEILKRHHMRNFKVAPR